MISADTFSTNKEAIWHCNNYYLNSINFYQKTLHDKVIY